jgi:hypothetical protein
MIQDFGMNRHAPGSTGKPGIISCSSWERMWRRQVYRPGSSNVALISNDRPGRVSILSL